jgi:anti-sigma-K factor RskA
VTDHLRQRLWELLADKASVGLTPSEEAELRALLDQFPEVDATELDRIAALLELTNPETHEPLPPQLGEQIERDAGAAPPFSPPQPSLFQRPEVRRLSWLAVSGWLAAATSLVLLMVLWVETRPAPVVPVEVAVAKLVDQPGTRQIEGKVLNDTPGVRGDVIWNNASQEGFLRVQGLPVNDPLRQQYQVWIVDAQRDTKYPVDGGVFDISREGEVIIPIRPRVPIRRPAAFLITREPAGGVVVSERKDPWLLAAVPPT